MTTKRFKWCPKGKCGKKVTLHRVDYQNNRKGVYKCSKCLREYTREELEVMNTFPNQSREKKRLYLKEYYKNKK